MQPFPARAGFCSPKPGRFRRFRLRQLRLRQSRLIGIVPLDEPEARLIEDDPFSLEDAEYDGHKNRYPHYRTPMRAALARLAGRGRSMEPSVFMARTLYRTWPDVSQGELLV